MKSKEELDALKAEIESVREKCCELTPEELAQVTGGVDPKERDIAMAFLKGNGFVPIP